MEIFRQVTANNLVLKPFPFLRELALEAYLLENEEILALDKSNFSEVTILDAELALKNGRKTSERDGRIDILAKYGMDYFAIIELKKDEVNENTLSQLEDYLNERNQLMQNYPEFWAENEIFPQWVGVLVGTSISPGLQRKLQEGYKTDSGIPIAGMVIRRFRGHDDNIYVVTDTFFNYNYTNRDFSKFEFNGGTYNKPRLVNKVLKYYAEKKPKMTYAELEQKFPPWIQGSLGVFTTKENAQDVFDNSGHKRFYIKPDELIKISDSTIATCTQWGIGNISAFVDHVNALEDELTIERK